MKTLILAAAILTAPLAAAVAHAETGCASGYVVGVPASNGHLPIKCVPAGAIPPGYVDGTGGNAPLDPHYGPTGQAQSYRFSPSGWKEDGPEPGDPGWYGNNGPCNPQPVGSKWSSDHRVMITIWGPQGCNPALPWANY